MDQLPTTLDWYWTEQMITDIFLTVDLWRLTLEISVCVWHRNETGLTDYNGIITNDSGSDNAWKIFKDGGQSFYTAKSNSTNLNFPSYVVGRFHHYAYTFNAGTLQLYFDAVAGNSTTGVSNPVSNTTVAFGSYRYADAVNLAYLTNQTIGGVYLYNRALSTSEI